MFVVQLKFSTNKTAAGQWMEAHKAWLQKGLDDGVFLLSGNLLPQAGGAILAHGLSRSDLDARLAADPFVEHGVVAADIIEIAASRADPRLTFLVS